MNDVVTKLLRGRKVLLGKDFYQFRQINRPRLTYGNRFADWTFCPDGLNERSVVYSFGVGDDVSFDLKLMEHFRMPVFTFDPSPRSIEWVKTQRLPEGFHFYPYGLGSIDGEISFSEPADPGYHSLYMTNPGSEEGNGIVTHVLPVNRLETIMKELGHERLDILKMDIEGAEYEVIEEIIALPVEISQVLIEFHHRFGHIGIGKTKQAIAALNRAGYRIFNVSASGEEISFIQSGK